KVFQVRKTRVTGAEVVDRHSKALIAQLLQHLANRIQIMQQTRFGDFELDPRRFASGFTNDPADPLREICAIELATRQVNRYRERQTALAPSRALRGRGAQHPVAERVDQARFFGQWDENLWRDVTELRM